MKLNNPKRTGELIFEVLGQAEGRVCVVLDQPPHVTKETRPKYFAALLNNRRAAYRCDKATVIPPPRFKSSFGQGRRKGLRD